MAALTMARGNVPQYFLQVESRRKNVFVTQLGEHREEDNEDVTYIPVICEAPSNVLQDHRNTLQKKEVKYDQVTAELNAKKREFQVKMEALAQRRAELDQKEQDSRTRALKFERFFKECELKKQRAIRKCQSERKIIETKNNEIHALKKKLTELKVRQQKLLKKLAKHKVFEEFLKKTANMLPADYLEYGADSLVMALIKRHETLLTTNQNLMKNMSVLLQDLEKSQLELGNIQEEHDTAKIMLITRLSELQTKCNILQEKNAQLEMYVSNKTGNIRNQHQETSRMLLAISSLGEQCYMRHYGPLKEMVVLSKLDMIQEFMLEKMQIKQETLKPAP